MTHTDVVWSTREFNEQVVRVLQLLEPLEGDLAVIQLVPLLQYVTGVYMAAAGVVFPEHPLHPSLTALSEGFAASIDQLHRKGCE